MVKKTTVAIVLLLIIAILGWVFWLGLSITAGIEMGLLKSENEALKSSYDSLDAEYAKLRESYDKLSVEHSELKSDYSSLKFDYDSLKEDYNELSSKHDKLLSTIERGEAIAESATWLTEDKRLKVTSELIPEFLFDELWSYTVRVSMTNVGDEPLDVVYIFLFPYKNDEFAERYFHYSYHSVEALYMGETYSYEFTGISKEMTTYKVLAVAG